jgi:hypothetical protein
MGTTEGTLGTCAVRHKSTAASLEAGDAVVCLELRAVLLPIACQFRIEWDVVVSAVGAAERTRKRKWHLERLAAGEAAQKVVGFRRPHRL